MKHLLLVVIAGCATQGDGSNTVESPPPPVVTDLSPATAGYGATITITGTGFTTAGSLGFSGVPEDGMGGSVITSWSDTQIVARVPFPATAGAIRVVNSAGEADTPELTPIAPWTAGDSATTNHVLAARRFGTTTDVLALDFAKHVQLISFGATTSTYTLDGITGGTDERTPTLAMLVGADHVVATGAADHLIDFTIANGTIVASDTGLVGSLVAADANGAWIQSYDAANGNYPLSHASPGAPWTIDRGPFVTLGVLAAQIANDGTLVVAWSHPDGSIFDNMANLAVARIAPGATALSPTEYPEDTAWDDYIAAVQLQMAPDGQRMLLAYWSQENNKDYDVPHPTLERATAGTWTEAQGAAIADVPLAYTATSIAALSSSGDDLAIVPDIATPDTNQPLPLWPAQGAALVTDGTTLLPVIELGDRIWAPAPPR